MILLRIASLLWLTAAASMAQTAGASLQGTVTDPSGAVLPGAQIQIRNIETGAVARHESDMAGRFRAPVLPPGDYEVHIVAQGFQPVNQKGIHLTVGQEMVLNIELAIGQTVGEITVQAQTSNINLVSGSLSGLVDDKQIRDLPLNGRSFQQLALLEPGVNAALAAGNDVVGGRSPKISINGARPEQSSFLLDGTDINNVYNKTPGSVGGVLLGVEAVLEFQVLTNAYSAEFGRSAGGIINAVTRSGTNAVHGSAFEFLRNSKMDAKNFFDPASAPIPPFKRNQFGATVGGPIRRDRTFFFGAFESLIERLGVTGVANVPDLDARGGVLAGRQIPLHPAIPQYLQTLFPLPNGRSLGGGVAEYLFTRSQPTDEYFTQGRVDHTFSTKDALYGRYTFDNGNVSRQVINTPPIVFTKERSRNQYVTIEERHVFSSSLFNTAKIGYNRSTTEADNQRTIDIPPSLSWIPGEKFGYLTITGMVTEMAGDYRLPRNDHLNNYQWDDTLFWTRGRHSLRLGFSGQRMQFNQNTTSQQGGIVTFAGLENFLRGIPQSVDFAVPGKIDPNRGYRQSLWGFFAQDDVHLRRNLTLNLGLRYEFATVPTEVNGKISNLRNVTDAALKIGPPWHSNPSLKNFAPRVGLAWDPWGDGKTSVRAGFGIFYDEILPKYYFFSGSLNPPFTTRTTLPNPPFPNVVAAFDANAPIKAQLQTINYDLQSSYLMQFNFNIQRSLPGGVDVTAGYAGSRGLHLFRIGDANLAPETIVNGIKTYQPQLGRRNPNFSTITQRITDAQSFYNALQLSAVKRLSHDLRAQASYTFSRSIDDSSGINSQDYTNGVTYVADFYDRKYDRGLSAFFAQHVFTFNFTYDLPLGRGLHGLPGAMLKGWQLNNITTLQSGHPFEVILGFDRANNLNTTSFSRHERPNVKPGYSNNPILGGPDRYWDINAFELQPVNTRGNLGRNTLIGPKLMNSDVSLVKQWKLAESKTLDFRAEFFNFPNHPNFAVPSGRTAFTSATAIGADWGRITRTVTTSRQIQFGLKLAF